MKNRIDFHIYLDYYYGVFQAHANQKGVAEMIGKNIKLYLIHHDIKQRTVADRIDLDYDKLCQSLNGKRKLDVEEFAKIVRVLGVSADIFLNDRPI